MSQPDDPWCRHLPRLHRALADPEARLDLPHFTRAMRLEESCAYWETLRYLLCALLGWRDIAAGLSWWYASGKSDLGDPPLRLVSSVWDSEGQMDYFAAHEWSDTSGISPEELNPASQARGPFWPDEDWWRALKRRGRPYLHDPFYGGSNPLHLGHSDAFGCALPSAPFRGFWDKEQRYAVLVVDGFASWRGELLAFAEQLPSLGERSWRVEVFDRVVGYLGLYRKSRVTGLWFVGKHSLHMRGNSQGAGAA
jgi:hypothetical protein